MTNSVNEPIRYFRNDGRLTPSKGRPGEAAAYKKARDLILSHQGVDPTKVDDFDIDFRSQIATYTDPTTQQTESVDLPSIDNSEIQTALSHYYKTARAIRWQKYAEVIPHSKGDNRNKEALVRNTNALKKLTIEKPEEHIAQRLLRLQSPEERNAMSRRFFFFDHFRAKCLEKIKEKVDSRKERLKNPTLPDAQAIKCQKEHEKLSKLYEEIDSIDLFAIYNVLERIPMQKVNSLALDEIAEELQKHILSKIKPTKFFGVMKASHSYADVEYAKDVAGLLYLDRGSYYKYCEKNQIERKREGSIDVFIREALKFAVSSEGKYSADGFQDSILLYEFSDDLKKEIQEDLHTLGRITSHAIGNGNLENYKVDEFPEKATKKEQQNYIKTEVNKLTEAIKEHKKSIRDDLKLSDIPAEEEPVAPPAEEPPVSQPAPQQQESLPMEEKPGIKTLAKTALLTTGTTAALTVGALGTGLIDPFTVTKLFYSLRNHPGHVITGITLTDTLYYKLRTFIAPRIRDRNTGEIKRKINYKKLALVSSSAMMAMLAAWAMYHETHDGKKEGSILEQAGEISGSMLNATANAVDFIWNNSFFQLPVGPVDIPGTNLTWGGSIPVAAVVETGRLLNRVPMVRIISEPIHRAFSNVLIGSAFSPAANFSYAQGKKGAKWAKETAFALKDRASFVSNYGRKFLQQVNSLWQPITAPSINFSGAF